MSPDLHARVDALFADLAGRAAPGFAIGLMRNGEVLLTRGYGQASLTQPAPMRGDTRLRIASVSKQFTVAAALLLEREGRLGREDDLRTLLPELASLPAAVTVGQLMRNTSGLPDMLELLRLGGVNLDLRLDRAALLRVMARCRHLNFAPGSRFLYSNSGFALLGLIVERLSGQSLGDFLQQHFFAPLGMQHTRMLVESDVPLAGMASPYLADGTGAWRSAQHGFEHGGEGGLVSTAQDLLLWAAHLLKPAAGVADVGAELIGRQALTGGCASPYAHGLEHSWLDTAPGEPGIGGVGHGGLWPGYRSEFLLLPEAGLAIVVLSNDGGANPYKKARELARVLLDLPPPAMDDAGAAALCGRWLHEGAGQCFELSLQNGRLMAQQWGVSFELEARADGSWQPLRGAYEFQLLGRRGEQLEIDVGAGQRLHCQRVAPLAALPEGLSGDYWCEDIACWWRLSPGGAAGLQLWVEGPLLKPEAPWQLEALTPELLELRSPGYWMQGRQLLRPERDASGRVQALRVDSGRVKGLRFQRRE